MHMTNQDTIWVKYVFVLKIYITVSILIAYGMDLFTPPMLYLAYIYTA